MMRLDACPLCDAFPPFAEHKQCRDYLVSGSIFSIERCGRCGFLFTNPRPKHADMHKHYLSEDYISHEVKADTLMAKIYFRVQRHMLSRKLKIINKFSGKEVVRLLDYGAGVGSFVLAANAFGFEAIGYEPHSGARQQAAARGVPMLSEDFHEDQAAVGPFDVITLWHVLEHVPDLKPRLSSLHTMLEDKGLLVIAVPLERSLDARFYGKYWAAWDVPRHLSHFNVNTLSEACGQAGFKLLKRFPLPFDSFYISLLSEQNRFAEKAIAEVRWYQKLFTTLRAGVVGGVSNIGGMFNLAPYSSEIFLFRKKI